MSKQTYFDFDQSQMSDRMTQVLTFRSIGPVIYAKPDLFNPLWINVTLAFVMSIVGNLSAYFVKADGFHFHFGVVQLRDFG